MDKNGAKEGAVVSFIAEAARARELGDRIGEMWARTVAESEMPGRRERLVEIYLEDEIEAELVARVLAQWDVRGTAVRPTVREEWSESWKRHFRPMEIGRNLRVVPPWMAGEGTGRTELVINPGLSFGTGNHFTTGFCLEQLDRLIPAECPSRMLDVGTGSGILAIAAVRLGVGHAVGTDNDPVCIAQAQENARINGVEDRTTFLLRDVADGSPDGPADLVCANLYASLLIEHAAGLLRMTRRVLILTGIREVEVDGVAETFQRLGGREVGRDSDHEWAGLVIRI